MMKKSNSLATVLLMGCLALPGCASAPDGQAPVAEGDTSPMSVTSDSATSVFVDFLERSVATRDPKLRSSDTVLIRSTGEGSAFVAWDDADELRWLAAFKVLSVEATADTAVGRVQITTVATITETDGPGRLTAIMGVREDTADWVLMRNAETGGRWKVRGSALQGFAFHEGPRAPKWEPAGASAQAAKAMIDSIRKARGLPIVR